MGELLTQPEEPTNNENGAEETIQAVGVEMKNVAGPALENLGAWVAESGKKDVWFGPKPKTGKEEKELSLGEWQQVRKMQGHG